MTWSKLAGFCSLKAIAVACFLTPVTVPATGITAAHAQFNIIIPNLQFHISGPRRYGYGRRYTNRRGHYRVARKKGGGQQQEASSSSSSNSSSQSLSAPKTANRGFRGNTD